MAASSGGRTPRTVVARSGRLVRLAGVSPAQTFRTLEALELAGVSLDLRPRGYLLDLSLRATAGSAAARGADPERALEAVIAAFGDHVFAVGRRTLAAVVTELLRRHDTTVSTAESCTGGRLATALTSVPGASDVFWGGVVAYDDAAKRELVAVSARTLAEHGAVSEAVAGEMARGVRRRSGTTWGVAVTGIAGPGGGTPEKPVGTVWVAVSGPRAVTVRLRFGGDRREVRRRSAQAALDTLRRCCLPA